MSITIDNGELVTSIKSTYNTTTTPLTATATYTGSYEQNAFTDVGVSCQTDVAGTLFFDFSNDGLVTNTFPVNGFTIQAGIHEFHTAVKLGRFFRVRLVNGSTAQSFLRIHTYYGSFRQGNLPVGSTINDDSDCIIVREPYNFIDIARNKVQSVTPFSKFGENSSITTTIAPVTSSGLYQTPTTAETLEILSTSANDTSAGSGARSVKVIGLDTDWAEVEEDIVMNGTTPVTLSTAFRRVYRMYVLESGVYATVTTGSHLGEITLRGASGGVTWATIPVIGGLAVGQSQIGCVTIPAGKEFFVETLELSASTSKTASIFLVKRENSDDVTVPFTGAYRLVRSYDKIDGTIAIPLRGLTVFPPKTDLAILALTSAGTASVSASLNGYLIDV